MKRAAHSPGMILRALTCSRKNVQNQEP